VSFRQTSDKAAEGAESSEILTVGLLKDEGFDELGGFVPLAPGKFGRKDRKRWTKCLRKDVFSSSRAFGAGASRQRCG